MANYTTLKSAIEAVITTNGNNEITGAILRQTLLSIIDEIANGFIFGGVATPDTNPGTPDNKLFYIATQSGHYTNLGGADLDGEKLAVFLWTDTWTTIILDVPTRSSIITALNTKVDKVVGKGLSTNDLTDALVLLINGAIQQSNIAQALGDDAAKVISQKAITDALVNYAKIDGYYASLIAGAAANLLGHGSVPASFLLRTSGGIADIGTGAARFSMIKGKSVVWNQLLLFNDKTKTINDVAFTVASGKITASGTASANGGRTDYISDGSTPLINGHKYLVINSTGLELIITSISATSVYYGLGNTSKVFTYSGTTFNNGRIGPQLTNGTQYDISGYCYLVDLTLAFGVGNEPTTVADFSALYWLNYYKHNAGRILPFAGQTFETTGFNQWDEEWEVGTIDVDNGSNVRLNTAIRSKNYIPVFPGTNYYYRTLYAQSPRIAYFDANKQFISCQYSGRQNAIFTTPTNCRFIRFATYSNYGNTYQNDICINLSWSGYRNGEYEPYEKNTYAINPAGWLDTDGNLIFPYGGMHGAGSAFDFAKPDSDGYVRKATKVMEKVDLGTCAASYNSTNQYFILTIPGLKGKAYNVLELVCSQYTNIGWSTSSQTDMAIRYSNSYDTKIWLRNLSKTGSDITDGKCPWLSGVYLVYETATPVEKTLQTPVSALFMVNDFGTEGWKPDNTDEPYTAPCNVEIAYAMNAVDTLRRLPENYISADSFDNFLALLGTQMNGTYTRTYNPATMEHEFTFTPNA